MKKYISYIIVAAIVFLGIVWGAYQIGARFNGIPTAIYAGDLLQYAGNIIVSVVTIFAVILTIKNSERNIKRELHKANYEKLYFKICDIAKEIMIFLSFNDLLSRFSEIIYSNTGSKPPKFYSIVEETRRNIRVLHKKQWYYYELLKNENYFESQNEDVRNVKVYFNYIHERLGKPNFDKEVDKMDFDKKSIDQILCDINLMDTETYITFYKALDKYCSSVLQHEIMDRTMKMMSSLKNLYIEKFKKSGFF